MLAIPPFSPPSLHALSASFPSLLSSDHIDTAMSRRPTRTGPRAVQPDQRCRSVSSPAATVAGTKPGALPGCRARVPAGHSSHAAPCPGQRSGPAECVPAPLRPGRPLPADASDRHRQAETGQGRARWRSQRARSRESPPREPLIPSARFKLETPPNPVISASQRRLPDSSGAC